MEPKIVDRDPLVVVGMKIITKPMSPEIPQLWPRFVSRIPEIAHILEPQASYGVMEMESGNAGGLSYLAGVSVADSAAPVPAGMSAAALPGGTYAVFQFPLSEIGHAFDFIFGTWLPSSAFTQTESPIFERYGEDFDPTDPSSRMEVQIPVRPRSSAA